MRYLKRDIGKQVIVQQVGTVIWSGTLTECGRAHIALTKATTGVATQVVADGRLVIPAARIDFVQVLG
ncbi:hypothetical protein ACTD5D_39820 [Nocardia takedensis]|uniref:hypothetical protein n=1 Tax=Nocardia takedensis TaxID=259390 RepID=UPI003F769796